MAPEIYQRKPYNYASADLFATAIILFIMVLGHPPFFKANSDDSYYKLLCTNRFDVFWNVHEKNKPKKPSKKPCYSEEFKDLIQKMLALKPEDRLGIAGIKAHPWYKGPTADISIIQVEFSTRKKQKSDKDMNFIMRHDKDVQSIVNGESRNIDLLFVRGCGSDLKREVPVYPSNNELDLEVQKWKGQVFEDYEDIKEVLLELAKQKKRKTDTRDELLDALWDKRRKEIEETGEMSQKADGSF